MLSTEIPPPDLPCPCEISQLKSSISDERASDDNLEVDLLKSGLDDNCPLSNFSIRDYVFNTRGKDIETNWPFSHKNLQLCLKHGVKDVLPPFQSLDSVRNPLIMECAVEDVSYSDVRLPRLTSHSFGQKLTFGSEEDKEFPSTTRSQSCSDINSIPSIKRPYLEPEAENFPEVSREKPEFAARKSNKVKRYTQNPAKNCRLIVKMSNIAAPKSDENLAVNTSAVISETMASKVCPVCKTFSSSSNTTLNAHIDQCLYGDSAIKRTTNSKDSKHRIRPRKSRLMVDIYETALHCTLEDLDRRNGTSWASNLARDLEAYAEENSEKYCSVDIEEANEEGAVYVDSNGTKLCSLSKLIDLPSNSNGKYDCVPRKLVNRDKGGKILSEKKKKYLLQKHKLLKNPFYGQRSCSPRPDHCSTVDDGQHKEFPPEGDKKKDLTQPIAHDQMKSDDLGMIKQWVGSKRTGIKKKIDLEHGKQHLDKVKKNLKVKSTMSSSLGDTLIKRTSTSNSPMSSNENALSPSESCQRKENMLGNSHDVYMEQPCLRKRQRFSLLSSKDSHGKNLCKKDGPQIHDSYTDPPANAKNHEISSEGKKFASPKKSSFDRAIPSGSKNFSSLRKNLLPVGNASVSESKKNLGMKQLDFKNPRLHYSLGSDEGAVVLSRSAIYKQVKRGEDAGQMGKASGRSLIKRTSVLKIQKKKREGFRNSSVVKNVDSFMDANFNVLEEAEIRDEFISETTYKEAYREEAFIPFSKSFDSPFLGLGGPSNVECVSQHYIQAYDDLVTSDTHMVAEIDANNEVQGNYFVDVDPIPIPGPPGSFLPSPGRMGSEELHGNSSLTTCRIQSSEDERELVDMESSDSPVSATSMVSNSVPYIKGSAERELNSLDELRGNTRPCCCSRKVQQNDSHNSEAKFPTRSDRESSPSPSTSNPVLRLMGKNLMVVNKHENLSPLQTRPTQSSIVIGHHQDLQLCVKNNDHYSFHHASYRDPSIFDNTQTKFSRQHFDFNSSNGFEIPSNFRTQQLSDHPSTVIFPSKSFGGSFTSSLKYHEYDIEKVGIIVPQFRTADSCGSKRNETIVIDDSPESEAGKAHWDVNRESSVGISASMAPVPVSYGTRGYPDRPFSGSSSQIPASRVSTCFVSLHK